MLAICSPQLGPTSSALIFVLRDVQVLGELLLDLVGLACVELADLDAQTAVAELLDDRVMAGGLLGVGLGLADGDARSSGW